MLNGEASISSYASILLASCLPSLNAMARSGRENSPQSTESDDLDFGLEQLLKLRLDIHPKKHLDEFYVARLSPILKYFLTSHHMDKSPNVLIIAIRACLSLQRFELVHQLLENPDYNCHLFISQSLHDKTRVVYNSQTPSISDQSAIHELFNDLTHVMRFRLAAPTCIIYVSHRRNVPNSLLELDLYVNNRGLCIATSTATQPEVMKMFLERDPPIRDPRYWASPATNSIYSRSGTDTSELPRSWSVVQSDASNRVSIPGMNLLGEDDAHQMNWIAWDSFMRGSEPTESVTPTAEINWADWDKLFPSFEILETRLSTGIDVPRAPTMMSTDFHGIPKVPSPLNPAQESGNLTRHFSLLDVLTNTFSQPQIQVGPYDLSCALLLCNVELPGMPIIYCSPSFEVLTGYTKHEVFGTNCRFLQAPGGRVQQGTKRVFVDDNSVSYLQRQIDNRQPAQVSIINYRKDGRPFMNLLTLLPCNQKGYIRFYIGLLIDLAERPDAIKGKNEDGTFNVDYRNPLSTIGKTNSNPGGGVASSALTTTTTQDEDSLEPLISRIGNSVTTIQSALDRLSSAATGASTTFSASKVHVSEDISSRAGVTEQNSTGTRSIFSITSPEADSPWSESDALPPPYALSPGVFPHMRNHYG